MKLEKILYKINKLKLTFTLLYTERKMYYTFKLEAQVSLYRSPDINKSS